MKTSFTEQAIERLDRLGLALPHNLPPPAGAYLAYRLHQGMGFLAAQVSGYDAPLGRVGNEVTLAQGKLAAQQAALNALGRIHQALEGFDRLTYLLHVAGHVSSDERFMEQPAILDGASELFAAVLGDRGLHTRTAYPSPWLPRNIVIELEITFAYEP